MKEAAHCHDRIKKLPKYRPEEQLVQRLTGHPEDDRQLLTHAMMLDMSSPYYGRKDV